MFARSACWRKSEEVSTSIVLPACSIKIEARRRLSRGSLERHVSQSHAIDGTPVDVPVPRKVNFIKSIHHRDTEATEFLSLYSLCLCGEPYLFPKMSAPENFFAACSFSFSSVARTIVTYCIRRSASRPSSNRASCS